MSSAKEEGSPSRGPVPRRFDRLARLVGAGAFRRLATAHVAVFGLGGVGSYVVEGLARSGIGQLTVVDFDDVCLTNFNRQLHAIEGTVGKAKCDLLAARVLAIDPDCRVTARRAFYEKSTADGLLDPRPDYVVDCVDNVTAKLHLTATCTRRGIPIVVCLGASAKLDPTRVSTSSLLDTHSDPLGYAIRRNLRRKYAMTDGELAGITSVFSDEPVMWPDPGHESALCGVDCICPGGLNPHHTCQKRRVVYGSSVVVTAVFGMVAAAAVVRGLLGMPSMQLRTANRPRRPRPARR